MVKVKLTTAEAASFMHLKPNTMAGWRTKGKGPPYSKVGRRVLYDLEELEKYLAVNTVNPEVVFPRCSETDVRGC